MVRLLNQCGFEEWKAWRSGHQKELKRLMDHAHKRRFDTVLVWALDRLSREGPLAILTLFSRLGAYGVQLISHQEPWIESAGPLRDVFLSLAGWVAR